MSTHDKLLSEIESFLDRTGMAHTTFGLRAVNDAKLVGHLRAGGDVRTRTADRILKFIREWKPHPKKRASYQPAA